MVTITLDSNSKIYAAGLDVFAAGKTEITGFVNVKTDGASWYFYSAWRYGSAADYEAGEDVQFDNLPYGLDRDILNPDGSEKYPTTDGGFTDYKKDIYRVCDRWRQVLEDNDSNLEGQIAVTGIS